MEKKKEMYTPQELIDDFPQLKKMGWSASKIGVLYSAKFLTGYYNGKEKKVNISIDSVKRAIDFINKSNTIHIDFESPNFNKTE